MEKQLHDNFSCETAKETRTRTRTHTTTKNARAHKCAFLSFSELFQLLNTMQSIFWKLQLSSLKSALQRWSMEAKTCSDWINPWVGTSVRRRAPVFSYNNIMHFIHYCCFMHLFYRLLHPVLMATKHRHIITF